MIIFIIVLWQMEVNKLKGKLGSLEEENNML
jgi:FtsZ-binding cell division protein ZapB